jgi:DUF2905 family protein
VQELGRLLLGIGALLVFTGAVLLVCGRLGLPLGRLPGDIAIRGKHFTFYAPIVTCLVLSLLLSLIFWLISHFRR